MYYSYSRIIFIQLNLMIYNNFLILRLNFDCSKPRGLGTLGILKGKNENFLILVPF